MARIAADPTTFHFEALDESVLGFQPSLSLYRAQRYGIWSLAEVVNPPKQPPRRSNAALGVGT
jgi:hypothetical protein